MLLLATMDATEALSTVAQLALGLIGFTGVVIALDHDPKKISRVEAYRLNVLLFSSSGAMFLALLPLGLDLLGSNQIVAWKVSSLSQAVFAFGFTLWFFPASRATMQIAPEIFNSNVWKRYLAGHLLNGSLQILAAVGIFQAQIAGIYFFGLFWLLFISMVQFRRMLLIHRNKLNGD